MDIEVCFTPQDYLRQTISRHHTVVVIDVLRATSSIITALSNGCTQFIPVATVEEALEKKLEVPGALLAGERQALHIEGFDLGNSPFEYSRAAVAGKTIIMSTTNGTVALKAAERAERVYVGAFVNAAAICSRLLADRQDVVLLCAGTQGCFSLEDALCAGLIVGRLKDKAKLGDTALAAHAMYRDFSGDLVARVKESSHAGYLVSIGFDEDVSYCLHSDMYNIAPKFIDGIVGV